MTNRSTMNNCISAKRKKNERECFHRSRTTILLLPMLAVAFTIFPRGDAQTRGDKLLQIRQHRSGRSANSNLAFVNNVDVGHDLLENEDSSILDNQQQPQRGLKMSKQRGGFQLGVNVNTKSSKKSSAAFKSKVTKSKASGKSSKASGRSSVSGKSKSSGKKSKPDNVFERHPTPHPTIAPPTPGGGPPSAPGPGGPPSTPGPGGPPSAPGPGGPPSAPGPGGTPTMQPIGFTFPPGPNVTPTPPPLGFPTQPTQPTQPTLPPVMRPAPTPETPTTPIPTVPPGTPTEPPSSPGSTDPQCTVGSDGLFGSQLGLAEETVYYYETIVTPTVTADELNIDILSRVENLMAGLILERLFARCASEATTRSNLSLMRNNLRRVLQDTQTISGWSLRPRDSVLGGVECTDTGSSFPCFVIEGRVTSFTEGTISDETKRRVRDAIRSAIDLGRLGRSDNRLLSVTYRDTDLNPIPTGPTAAPAGEGDTPVVRSTGEDDGDDGLATWVIAVIAVGGAMACLFAFYCLRRSSHSALKEDDSSSSSSSSASAKPTKEETEALTNNEPFVSPMPLFRPPINEDPPDSEYENKNKEWNVQSTPVPSTPVPERSFGDEEEKDVEASHESSASQSSQSEIEEESLESESESESESEESPPQTDQFAAIAATGRNNNPPKQRSQLSAFSQPDFGAPSFDDEEDSFGIPNNSFGDGDNAFGASAPPPALAPLQDSESEYSSYTEVEEEYEIEYVEDEGNLEDLVEEDEEESWYDIEDKKNATLPWLAPI